MSHQLPISLICWTLIVLTVSGCATLPEERRGTLESLGAAAVVAGVVIAVEGHKHRTMPPSHMSIGNPNCSVTPSLCQ